MNEEQEVSVNLASATEISLTVAELSELGGILNLKQEKRMKERKVNSSSAVVPYTNGKPQVEATESKWLNGQMVCPVTFDSFFLCCCPLSFFVRPQLQHFLWALFQMDPKYVTAVSASQCHFRFLPKKTTENRQFY